MISEKISNLICLLRIILTPLVITIHIPYKATIYTECFVAFISRSAVPLFFIISGFLFASSTYPFVIKIKKRIYALLIPFFAWMFVGFAFMELKISLGFASPDNIFANAKLLEKIILATGIFNTLPILDTPMWYIRNLFLICCLYPIIKKAIQSLPRFCITTCIAFYLFRINDLSSTITQTLTFFSIGVYISIFKLNITTLFEQKRTLFCCLFLLILIPLWIYFKEYYISEIFSQAGSLCFIYLIPCTLLAINTNKKILIDRNSFFVKSSFFVYAIHILLIPLACRIATKHIATNNLFFSSFNYILSFILVYLLSLLTFFICSKILPNKIWFLLNGNRI